jgi:hypothetical protein
MTITYTWKVTGVKVKNEGSNTDAVVQTYWTKIGIDENGNEGTFSGATPFTSVNVPSGEFVAFEDLTEEIILGWIQSVIDENYDIHINSQILKQIQSKANPVIDKELPWVVTE